VVLLNEAAAKELFPDGNSLGRRIAAGIPGHLNVGGNIPAEVVNPPWATVVGIVSNVRQFDYLSEPPPQVFVPYEQSLTLSGGRTQMALLVRTAGTSESMVNGLREVLRALDPNLPSDSIQTMSSLASESLRPQRFVALLLGIFAVVAVVLAAIGIYSVVAWAVAQRTREVGIRLALGASPDAVVTRLIRQGLMPVAIGVGLGLVVSFGLARVLASQLAQIKSYDPITYLLVSLFLGVVALLACWLPARRAARVDPMTALRTD
jgi:putative ABC transport system permease protein